MKRNKDLETTRPDLEYGDGGKNNKKKKKWPKVLAAFAVVAAVAFGGVSATYAISNTVNTGGFSLSGLLTSYRMFYGAGELTGQNGTTYSGNITDAEGAVIDSDSTAGYLSTKDDEDYNVKYAVSIYGINQDTCLDDDGDEQTAGLTFGPATGADYTSSYEAHLTEEEFLSGESGVCMHWMTWEEIAIQSEIDPTVFEECLENGCTHSVELVLNDTLLGTSYAGQMDDGDGASILYNSITSDYRRWNYTYSTSESSNIWSASRIRATLNGKDTLTDSTYAGSDTLSESESLLSCFPDELQDAIAKRVVVSSPSGTDTETTYDKLWLFSYKEIYDYDNTAYGLVYEGEQYLRLSLADVTTGGTTNSILVGYTESGSTNNWWLRSRNTGNTNIVYNVNSTGLLNNTNVTSNLCVAPGSCRGRRESRPYKDK